MEATTFKIIWDAVIGSGGGLFAAGAMAFAWFMYKDRKKSKEDRDKWQQKYIEGLEREKEVHKATREYLDKTKIELLDAIKRENKDT